MKLSYNSSIWHIDDENINTNVVILLVHNIKGQYGFIRGKSELLYPIFRYGYQNWQSYFPYSDKERRSIDSIFKRIPVPVGEDVLRASPELLTGEYRATDPGRVNFVLEDVEIRGRTIGLVIENISDALCFFDYNGKEDCFAIGYGSEKGDLATFGARMLFGKEIAEELELAAYGSESEIRFSRQMLRIFRESGKMGDGRYETIIVTPEAAEKILESGGNLHQLGLDRN